jgi:RNA polymerase sigma-70 factor, ECF subfamily
LVSGKSALRLVRPAPVADGEPGPCPELAAPDPEALFVSHGRYVATIATRLLGRDDEVADVVQEVFIVVVRGIGKLRRTEPETVKAWLATVTTRLAMRRLRWRRLRGWFRFQGAGDRAHDYEDLPDPSLSGEERAAVAAIYRLLDGLPAAHRSAWLLHHGEGMAAERVALACACSPATAKRWIAAVNETIRMAITHG